KAFGFEDVFLALVNREEVALDGTWTWKDGKELSSHRLRVPLLGDSGILAKSVWQHRPIAIQDPEAHPPFPGGHNPFLEEMLGGLVGFTTVPLQRSQGLLARPARAETCDARCPFGAAGKGDWYPPPGANGDWLEARDRQ